MADLQSLEDAASHRSGRSYLQPLVLGAIVCALPAWCIVGAIQEEMRALPPEEYRVFICYAAPPPDLWTGLAAFALQCAVLVVYRVVKDRRSMRFCLLAVPIPALIGSVITWYKFHQLAQWTNDGLVLLPRELAMTRSVFWSHTYFGLAASGLVLLLALCVLAWKKPAR